MTTEFHWDWSMPSNEDCYFNFTPNVDTLFTKQDNTYTLKKSISNEIIGSINFRLKNPFSLTEKKVIISRIEVRLGGALIYYIYKKYNNDKRYVSGSIDNFKAKVNFIDSNFSNKKLEFQFYDGQENKVAIFSSDIYGSNYLDINNTNFTIWPWVNDKYYTQGVALQLIKNYEYNGYNAIDAVNMQIEQNGQLFSMNYAGHYLVDETHNIYYPYFKFSNPYALNEEGGKIYVNGEKIYEFQQGEKYKPLELYFSTRNIKRKDNEGGTITYDSINPWRYGSKFNNSNICITFTKSGGPDIDRINLLDHGATIIALTKQSNNSNEYAGECSINNFTNYSSNIYFLKQESEHTEIIGFSDLEDYNQNSAIIPTLLQKENILPEDFVVTIPNNDYFINTPYDDNNNSNSFTPNIDLTSFEGNYNFDIVYKFSDNSIYKTFNNQEIVKYPKEITEYSCYMSVKINIIDSINVQTKTYDIEFKKSGENDTFSAIYFHRKQPAKFSQISLYNPDNEYKTNKLSYILEDNGLDREKNLSFNQLYSSNELGNLSFWDGCELSFISQNYKDSTQQQNNYKVVTIDTISTDSNNPNNIGIYWLENIDISYILPTDKYIYSESNNEAQGWKHFLTDPNYNLFNIYTIKPTIVYGQNQIGINCTPDSTNNEIIKIEKVLGLNKIVIGNGITVEGLTLSALNSGNIVFSGGTWS